LLALVVMSGPLTCAKGTSPERGAETVRSALVGATSCNVGVACPLNMPFPSGIHADELAIFGRSGVRVGSGSQVVGRNGRFGSLVSDTGEVRVEAGSHVGSIWTKGKAFVGGGTIVESGFFASAQSEVQAGAVVPPRAIAVGTPASVRWTALFPPVIAENINLEPDRERALQPGRYGDVRVASRSVLLLSTGTYYFDSYQLEPQARLRIDNRAGTAIIYVRGRLVHRGKIESLGQPSDVLIGSFSTERIDVGDEMDATLVAPSGQLVLARPPTGAHDGLFFAASVELQGGVRVNATRPSNTGPAAGGMGPTFTGATGVALPGPVPSPTGLSYEQWVQRANTFINQVIASNYSGPTIELPAHPEAARANQPADFAVPAGANVTVTPAPTIPPRPPGFPIPEASQEFRQEMAAAEAMITAKHPPLAQPESEVTGNYGTPVDTKVELLPETCVFTQQPGAPQPTVDNNGDPIVSLDDFAIQPLIPDVVLGNKPSYLVLKQGESDYDVDEALLPQFDGYWFFLARLTGGWNGVGMEAFAEAGIQAGCVILGHHNEFLRVFVSGDAATLHQVDQDDDKRHHGELRTRNIKPVFATSLETKLLGQKIEELSWESVPDDNTKSRFKKDLVNRTIPIFGSTPPTMPVGPFVIQVNGAAEVKIPLALNVETNGPEITFAPMFRVYLTLFAGFNTGIRAGVEGEVDLIRADMPFKGKAKWVDHLTPETCYSSADFKMTWQMSWSTLNGFIFVTFSIPNPLPFGPSEIRILRQEIFHWHGLKFESPEVDLTPTLTIPIIRRNQSECQFGAGACAESATPDRIVTGFTGQTQVFNATPPYGQADCPQQYVYEVPVQGTGASQIWLSTFWEPSEIDTQAECSDEKIFVQVYRQAADGTWSVWDGYRVLGFFENGQCVTKFEGGGKQSATVPTNPFNGFPWSWVDVTGGIQRVRVAVGGGTQCEARTLSLAVATSPL
jgi:hypothetical protein